MSRIDAAVATQVGDASRPYQTAVDHVQQRQQAQVRSTQDDDTDSLAGNDAPHPDEVRAAVAQLKQVIETASGKQLAFGVDDSGKTLLVKLMSDKGEIIRQIPSKEILDLRKRIDALVGMLVDKTA